MRKTLPPSIDGLRRLRQHHGVRAATLLPDLALIGLVDDTIDAAETALDLLEGPRPYRAYAMVRVAFEAAQRLLVLGTSHDICTLGLGLGCTTRVKMKHFGNGNAKRSIASKHK